MYKKILIGTGIITLALIVVAGVINNKTDIVIYTSLEDYRIEKLSIDLKREFSNKSIAIQYMSTGELVSRLRNEDVGTAADIVIGIEATNCEILLKEKPNIFKDLSSVYTGDYSVKNLYDESVLKDIPQSSYKENEYCKYHIFDKEAGCIIVNTKVLADKQLPVPTSFNDLLNPQYNGLICMPDPSYSGTGYYWVNGLASSWGEQKAMEYFEELNKNFAKNGYPQSGSGPLRMLERGEAAIGLGMSFQVAKSIYDNKDNPNYNINMTYFDITDSDGKTYSKASPYTLYTMALVNSKMQKEGVLDVYNYIYKEWTLKDKYESDPEKIYKTLQDTEDFKNKVKENFGEYIFPNSYMPMKSVFDANYKKKLLEAWSAWKDKI